MNTRPDPLDPFESALLTELRAHVAENPVTAPAPAPARVVRRPQARRWTLGGVAAAAVATVAVVAGTGGVGASPAYAVDRDADGDVVVTIHRLDDAAGLEAALADQGVDASVSYGESVPTTYSVGSGGSQPAPPRGGTDLPTAGVTSQYEIGSATDEGCDFAPKHPTTLAQDGDDWVLTIPAGSPLLERHVDIGTYTGGDLSVQYDGAEPGTVCGVVTTD